MTQVTREDALSFIEAIRLTVAGKAGFKWLDEKLSRLRDYVEALADENESYRAYLEETGAAADFESFRSRRTGG